MRPDLTLRLCALVFALHAGSAAAASEDTVVPSDTQQQPAQTSPPNPLPSTIASRDKPQGAVPVPDAGTTGQSGCIDETGDYEAHGAQVTYVIGLQNRCDKRLRCKIYAYVVGAKGPSSAQTTLILGAVSSRAAAKGTYAMPVKAAGGTAQVSRECRVF